MENLLGEFDLLNPGGEFLKGNPVVSDVSILSLLKTAGGDKATDVFHLPGIQPNTMPTADVDHDPGNLLKVFFVIGVPQRTQLR